MRDDSCDSRMSNEQIQDQYLHDRPRADTSIRSLQIFRSASFLCGIFQNEIATIVPWREPTPLPQSPHTVLGVVSIQGRMLTVLDLSALLDTGTVAGDRSHQHILALRGDEQLALAIDSVVELSRLRVMFFTLSNRR